MRWIPRRSLVALLGALVLTGAALGLAACGDEESTSDSSTAASASGSTADAVFAAEMIPHHADAIAMARIALERSQRPEIRELAQSIVTSQEAEVDLLEQERADLPEVTPGGDHTMSSGSMNELETAKPFERAFIDAMIPHHQGAITMAQAELEEGTDPELRSLAEEIIDEQTAEIDQMQMWREEWYGAPSSSQQMGGHGG